ncbi:MAG: glycoside hydrolase family 97 protein [Bacteroidota bacterium]
MTNSTKKATVDSPNQRIKVEFHLTDQGTPAYAVKYNDKHIIDTSSLGFSFIDNKELGTQMEIIDWQMELSEETWEMPWGEKREVRNKYNQLSVQLQETTENPRKVNLVFKVYNDGVGFRYEFPNQKHFDEALIEEEHTEFNLTGNHTCWWSPGDWDIYEHLYNTSKFSEIDASVFRSDDNLAQSHIPHNAVNTPITMRTQDGLHLSFHEANLTDYAGMTLKVFPDKQQMKSVLVGSERTDYKVKRKVPFNTPWRTIQIAEKSTGLIESDLIVNLNEPNKLGDIDWFTPMKYAGIWWDMHLGRKTWDYAGSQDMNSYGEGESSTTHGATTEYAREMIDFAAENNIKGLLVEGWNTGWENWIGVDDREGIFDFVTPYPDYDLKEVVEYGRSKGVELIMHHETSAAVTTYEKQLDTAFKLMEDLGIHSLKTGYVGTIIPQGEYHHGQWMVNHYRKVLKKGAEHQVAINAHEPIKATGIRRTYPNAVSREGLRGQEFNAWASDGGNPPEHLPIIAFTRMLSGPIDFTPGIFNIKLDPYKENNQVNTTLAHQLALYVVINSPVQMVPDLPKYYEGHPAFQFIREVGVNWEQTKALNGEVGDYVTIARQERETGNWFLGAITDEEPRNITVELDFLEPETQYKAVVYRDGKDAHWNKNPQSYHIEEMLVNEKDTLELELAAGGGAAISFFRQ